MSSIPESVRIKIERAYHHIKDLQPAIDRFWETGPYKFIGYIDSQRRPTYQLASIEPIDPMIRAIAGDAIQNFRTALDYLACTLWRKTNSGDCKIYFPIAECASKYKSEALGKAQGLRQDFIDAISAVEPYGGGKGDSLWRLHRLSIIDKHRLPIAVAGANAGIHLPSLYPELFPEGAKSNPWIISTAAMKIPLKDGDIIFQDDPGREVKKDLQLPLFVALDEPGVIERKPLIPALKSLGDFANNVMTDLAGLL